MPSHFKYSIKRIFRSRSFFLWAFVFPLVYALAIYYALSGIMMDNTGNTQALVGVEVSGTPHQTSLVYSILDKIVDQTNLDEDKTLETIFDFSETGKGLTYYKIAGENHDKLLEEGLVDGVVEIDNSNYQFDYQIKYLDQPSSKQDYINQFFESFAQAYKSAAKAGEGGIGEVDLSPLVKIAGEEKNSMSVYFYSVISYLCFYYFTIGLSIFNDYEADTSVCAIRHNIAKISRRKSFWVDFINVFILAYILIVLVCMFYQFKGISIWPEARTGYLLVYLGLSLSLGLLTGSGLASLLGRYKKVLDGLSIALPLVLSALAGMMGPIIRQQVIQNLPWLDKINPMANSVYSLYALNFYSNISLPLANIKQLLVYNLIFFLLTNYGLRGRRYASL